MSNSSVLQLESEPGTSLGTPSGLVVEELVVEELVVEEHQVSAASAVAKTRPWQAWRIFGSTFITIFLAELGDKTQVSTLLMSAEFHAPWVVFAGAASALITTSLLGVLVGRWLSSRLSPKTLDTAAGIMLALISAWLIFDVIQG